MPIETKCKICEKKMMWKPSRVKRSVNHFCSIKCKGKYQETISTWNKGIKCPPLSEEHKNKISIKTREALSSPSIRKKLRDSRAKQIITEETKQKLSKSLSGDKNPMYGRIGNKNPNWKGGVSYWRKKYYQEPEYKKWHAAVLKRDNYECKMCGQKKTVKGILHVHHIRSFAKYPKLRTDLENGIVLCKKCHDFIHSRKAGLGKVKSIEKLQEKIEMIDIEVKDNNNFFANDILVHNSGTVARDDGNEMIMESLIGPIIYKISADTLIDKGHLIRPTIKFLPMPFYDVEGSYSEVYDECVVRDVERNNKIFRLVEDNLDKQILILVNRIEHGNILNDNITNSLFIHGSLDREKREKYLEKFKEGKFKVLIGTASIMAEGVNIKTLQIVINASANKGDVKTIQMLGRGLRTAEGKIDMIYYDFLDEAPYLKEAAKARIKCLEDQGYVVERY